MPTSATILITGCNGKLGRAVSELLLQHGFKVVGVDAVAAAGRPHPVVVDSLLDPHAIFRAFERVDGGGVPDAVVHLANHTNSLVAPNEVVLRENLAMNTSVFMAALAAGVRRVVFSSSIQAMVPNIEADGTSGERIPHRLPISESIETRPTNGYGLSKLLSEQMLARLCTYDLFRAGLSGVSLRLPYILGPKAFDGNVTRTSPAEYMWGGPEAFSYVAVEDAAEAVRRTATAELTGHAVLWTAAPDPRTADSVKTLASRFYGGVPGVEESVRRDSFVDCSRATALLGWEARKVLRVERERRGISPAAAP